MPNTNLANTYGYDGQGNALATPPWMSNIPNTVSGSAINNPPSNITPPLVTPPTDLLAGLGANLQSQSDASTSQQSSEANTYINLLNQLGQQTPDTQTLQNQQGVTDMQKQLVDLQKVANQQQAQYTAGYIGAEAQRNTRGETNVVQQNLTRQHGIDALLTNSLISAKQGDLTYANNLVDRAIAAKYDPIKAKIDAQKFVLDQINTKASEDKKRALDVKLKQIDKQQEDDKSMQAMIIDATAQSAPANILKAAQDLIKTGAKPSEVATLLGKYSGAYAKNELLKEQIKTEKAQQANYYASANKTNSEATSGKPANDTQITNAGYATRIAQANNVIDTNADIISKMSYPEFKAMESNSPIVSSFMSPAQQQIAQAMRNFITAKLRKESGASISPTEFEDARLNYFPQYGDSTEVLAQKKATRDSVLQNNIQGAGSAYIAPVAPVNNIFSNAVGGAKFTGTSILAPSSDGGLNFIIPSITPNSKK